MTQLAAGICLTFDDLNVANWCAARPIFDLYGARVTFCVARLGRAREEQVAGLKALQADGHEIGFHSRTHPRLDTYLAEHGVEHWLRHEIDEGVDEHRAQGFPATSFASPYHASTPETLAGTATRFKIVRNKGPGRLTKNRFPERIYTRPGPDNAVNNIGLADMQLRAFAGWRWHHLILDTIVARGGVGVFTGHNILPERAGPGYYSTHRQLHRMLDAAKSRGLRFYTLSEFADLAG